MKATITTSGVASGSSSIGIAWVPGHIDGRHMCFDFWLLAAGWTAAATAAITLKCRSDPGSVFSHYVLGFFVVFVFVTVNRHYILPPHNNDSPPELRSPQPAWKPIENGVFVCCFYGNRTSDRVSCSSSRSSWRWRFWWRRPSHYGERTVKKLTKKMEKKIARMVAAGWPL